jgi:hypothetical protein
MGIVGRLAPTCQLLLVRLDADRLLTYSRTPKEFPA